MSCMEFKILTNTGVDNNEWEKILNHLSQEFRDIHYLPEYGRIYKQTYDQEPFLAYYGNDDEFILQTFVKRRLNDLPFLMKQNIVEKYYDIANPYGYGGPIINAHSEKMSIKLYREFNNYFKNYCQEMGFASEFCSLHPLLETQNIILKTGEIPVKEEKQIVYIDLSLTEEQIYKNINRGHKSGINKARECGVKVVKVEPTDMNFNHFCSLYYETMRRNNAAERWFFPKNYFYNCYSNLGEDNLSLFFAMFDTSIVSAYMLIHYGDTVYYHFGASNDAFFYLRPNNLMMFETALWSKRNGFLKYHLGGGITSREDDNLFRFKSGFSKDKKTLYSYHRIHNADVYERLCLLKKEYEISENGMEIESSFFPMYRR